MRQLHIVILIVNLNYLINLTFTIDFDSSPQLHSSLFSVMHSKGSWMFPLHRYFDIMLSLSHVLVYFWKYVSYYYWFRLS